MPLSDIIVLKKEYIKGEKKVEIYFGHNFEVDDVQTSGASINTLTYPLKEKLTTQKDQGPCTNISLVA